jgi:predicted RNA-binding protein with PUA-like domain
MSGWLFKEEPSHYSFADLERDGQTRWDGVSNALALQHLRKIRPGDRVFFYHTGKEKAIVGEMRVVDGSAEGVVIVAPVRRLRRPVQLARIKADSRLADWELVRLPRLSVLPVSDEQWQCIEELECGDGD